MGLPRPSWYFTVVESEDSMSAKYQFFQCPAFPRVCACRKYQLLKPKERIECVLETWVFQSSPPFIHWSQAVHSVSNIPEPAPLPAWPSPRVYPCRLPDDETGQEGLRSALAESWPVKK